MNKLQARLQTISGKLPQETSPLRSVTLLTNEEKLVASGGATTSSGGGHVTKPATKKR